MVARRPYGAESTLDLSPPAPLHRFHNRARRMERGIKRTLGQKGIGVEFSCAEVPDFFYIFLRMDAGDIFECRPPRFDRDQSRPEARCLERDDDVNESIGRIWMPDRRLVTEKNFIEYKSDFLHEKDYRQPDNLELKKWSA